MLRRRRVLFSVIILLLFIGCNGGREDEVVSGIQPAVLKPLLSEELLAEAGLKMAWQREMPMKAGEKLVNLQVIGDRVYGISSSNYLLSLNRHNGRFAFGRNLGEAGSPILGLDHFENEMYSVVGNRLVEIDLGFGEDKGEKRFTFGVVCPAVRNSRFFYVGGSDRRVHAFNAETKVQVFEAAAMSDSVITNVLAREGFAAFTTMAGDLVCIDPDRPRQLWEPFKAEEAIVGPIVKDGSQLIFSSMDTNVYSVDLLRGELNWKFPAGAVLKRGPAVTGGTVYQHVDERGLVAVDKMEGRFRWQLDNGVDLLAESRGKAYVFTRGGRLVVMDNSKGEQLYTVNFFGVSKHAVNVIDSKMYVSDERGRIACLQPIEE